MARAVSHRAKVRGEMTIEDEVRAIVVKLTREHLSIMGNELFQHSIHYQRPVDEAVAALMRLMGRESKMTTDPTFLPHYREIAVGDRRIKFTMDEPISIQIGLTRYELSASDFTSMLEQREPHAALATLRWVQGLPRSADPRKSKG